MAAKADECPDIGAGSVPGALAADLRKTARAVSGGSGKSQRNLEVTRWTRDM
jgi:hypothetical protein